MVKGEDFARDASQTIVASGVEVQGATSQR